MQFEGAYILPFEKELCKFNVWFSIEGPPQWSAVSNPLPDISNIERFRSLHISHIYSVVNKCWTINGSRPTHRAAVAAWLNASQRRGVT